MRARNTMPQQKIPARLKTQSWKEACVDYICGAGGQHYNNGRSRSDEMQTYYDLYNFLKKNISVFEDDSNFVDFYNAMFRHTRDNVNDYLYYEMLEKFVRRINEATKQCINILKNEL